MEASLSERAGEVAIPVGCPAKTAGKLSLC